MLLLYQAEIQLSAKKSQWGLLYFQNSHALLLKHRLLHTDHTLPYTVSQTSPILQPNVVPNKILLSKVDVSFSCQIQVTGFGLNCDALFPSTLILFEEECAAVTVKRF